MKNYIFPLFLILSVLFISCEKKETDPVNTCRLDKIDRGTGFLHEYTYNEAGKVATMKRVFGDDGTYLYTLSYDAAGLLSKADVKFNGTDYSSKSYVYTNGKVSQVKFKNVDGTSGVNNIIYNAQGLITKYTFEADDKSFNDEQFFEYDTQGAYTRRGYKDILGNIIYFEAKYSAKNHQKSPEQLLESHGLPFDLLTGFSWRKTEEGTGSISESFSLNEKNILASIGSTEVTETKNNTKGYLIEISTKDNEGMFSKSIYTISSCQ